MLGAEILFVADKMIRIYSSYYSGGVLFDRFKCISEANSLSEDILLLNSPSKIFADISTLFIFTNIVSRYIVSK